MGTCVMPSVLTAAESLLFQAPFAAMPIGILMPA